MTRKQLTTRTGRTPTTGGLRGSAKAAKERLNLAGLRGMRASLYEAMLKRASATSGGKFSAVRGLARVEPNLPSELQKLARSSILVLILNVEPYSYAKDDLIPFILEEMKDKPRKEAKELLALIEQELKRLGTTLQLSPDRRVDTLRQVLRDLSGPKRKAILAAASWQSEPGGLTAYEHFEKHFSQLPLNERPAAHIVLAVNRKFYDALAVYQHRRGASPDQRSIGSLFPVDGVVNKAGGGGRPRKHLTAEEALAIEQRRRERNRERMAKKRRKLKDVKPN